MPGATTLDELLGMSIADRLSLVQLLWDSIAQDSASRPEASLEVPESHREELRRRLLAHRADPTGGSPWSEVRQRIQARK